MSHYPYPDETGRYGAFGGRYVPETLMSALLQLEPDYLRLSRDETFQAELKYYLAQYAGRPTPLYYAERLTKHLGGPKIYLKREDLNHTGAHKVNNTIGQALLAVETGRNESSRRRAPASTVWRPRRWPRDLGWSARCSWAKKTCVGRR